MSELTSGQSVASVECILGVQSCGCVTYANTRPDSLDRDDQKDIARIISKGGSIIRTTVEEARGRENFLPSECPHDPKGWEYTPPPEPPRLRFKRAHSFGRDAWHVDARVPPEWDHAPVFRAGQVRKDDRKWWATEEYFDGYTGHTAHGPGDVPSDVLGPFDSKKDAGAALLPLARQRALDLTAEWDRKRAERNLAKETSGTAPTAPRMTNQNSGGSDE
jgi:hypothetical protein